MCTCEYLCVIYVCNVHTNTCILHIIYSSTIPYIHTYVHAARTYVPYIHMYVHKHGSTSQTITRLRYTEILLCAQWYPPSIPPPDRLICHKFLEGIHQYVMYRYQIGYHTNKYKTQYVRSRPSLTQTNCGTSGG